MQAICQECNKDFKFGSSKTGKFCSNLCSQDNRRKREFERFLKGEVIGRSNLRDHLVRIHGWKCMCCNNTEWQGKPIPLELDHIDGNAGNSLPENVRNLCPNCHAQTPTHKARNKGNGRGSRGLPWY